MASYKGQTRTPYTVAQEQAAKKATVVIETESKQAEPKKRGRKAKED